MNLECGKFDTPARLNKSLDSTLNEKHRTIQRRISGLMLCMAITMALTACASTGNSQGPDDDKNGVALLRYSVKEPGREQEFISELIVAKHRMVIREANDARNYLLFNRENQTIYSVTAEDQSIFVITPKPISVQPPIEVKYEEASQPSAAMPKIQNMPATHFRYNANGSHCYDVVALPESFLPDVRKALIEYRTVLAGEHAAGLKSIPKDIIEACDISLNVFHATKHLQHGVPIREWDRKGNQKFMVDFQENWQLDMSQFDLPPSYKQYSVF